MAKQERSRRRHTDPAGPAGPTGRPSLCKTASDADASHPQGVKQESSKPTVISKRADFLAANKGLRVARPGFVLLTRPNGGLGKRYGITVTKRIGNAVVRNRMKRRFRELLWDALPEEGLADHDHILIGRDDGIERDFAKLRSELSAALARMREGKGDPARRRNTRTRHRKPDNHKPRNTLDRPA